MTEERKYFEDLKGEIITDIEGLENGSTEIIFKTASGDTWELSHQQD